MLKKANIQRLIVLLLCTLFLGAFSSCNTSHNNTRKDGYYTKKRTKQARWNSTTSLTSTYYVKKKDRYDVNKHHHKKTKKIRK